MYKGRLLEFEKKKKTKKKQGFTVWRTGFGRGYEHVSECE
jgi:hypothetical protein